MGIFKFCAISSIEDKAGVASSNTMIALPILFMFIAFNFNGFSRYSVRCSVSETLPVYVLY